MAYANLCLATFVRQLNLSTEKPQAAYGLPAIAKKTTLQVDKIVLMATHRQPRRQFLQTGVTAVVASLFGSLPQTGFANALSGDNDGIVVHEYEGIQILTRRKIPITIKISKAKHGVQGISFCIEEMEPRRKMRVHKHLYHDELVFIHRGQGTLTLGEQSINVNTGTVAYIPKGTWHGLDNTGQEKLQMVFQYTPAGFEEYFIENGTPVGMPAKERTAEEYKATEEKYGMVYKDGSPDQ